jgi:predicted GTPase
MESERLNIVVLGETGVGKSTICNSLLNEPNKFEVGSGIEAVTLKAKGEDGQLLGNGADVKVIDTQGYNDPNNRDFENAKDMIALIKSLKEVRVFLIVLNGSNIRWNEATWNIFSLFHSMFPSFWRNVIMVVNFWPMDERSVKVRTSINRTERHLREDIRTKMGQRFEGLPEFPIHFLDAAYIDEDEKRTFFNNLRALEVIWSTMSNYATTQLEPEMKESDKNKQIVNDLKDELEKVKLGCTYQHDYKVTIEKKMDYRHYGDWGGLLYGHKCCSKCRGQFSCSNHDCVCDKPREITRTLAVCQRCAHSKEV